MQIEFLDWYSKNEDRFAHSQFDDKQIAYSAWLEGKKRVNKAENLPISDVSDCLSIKQVAVRYGQKVKCKWLTPDGNDWLDKEMIVNAHFLKEMEQGSIKDCR
jgi:hypothetical protein